VLVYLVLRYTTGMTLLKIRTRDFDTLKDSSKNCTNELKE